MGRFIAAGSIGILAFALAIAALVMGVSALDQGLSRWLRDPALGAALSMATLLVLALAAVVVAYACLKRPKRVTQASTPMAPSADLSEAAAGFARKNPWLAVGAAFAAGFLSSNSKTTEQLLAELLKQAQRE